MNKYIGKEIWSEFDKVSVDKVKKDCLILF